MRLTTFSYSLVFLCAGFCCPDDDIDTAYYNIRQNDLIEIEDSQRLFEVNDTLWITTEAPVILEYEGESLNISEVAGNSDRLYAYLGLYQQTSFENPLPVYLSENEIVERIGEITTDQALIATAFLDGNTFRNSFGIILKEKGDFLLSHGYVPGKVNLSLDTSNYTSVEVSTSFKDAEDPSRYKFRVE